MRTRFTYAICVRDAILRTRFCVRDAILCTRLEFSSTAIFRTKLGAIYVRDLRTRRDFAYAILCTRRDFSRLRESRTQKILRTRNAVRLVPLNRVRRVFLMPCLLNRNLKVLKFATLGFFSMVVIRVANRVLNRVSIAIRNPETFWNESGLRIESQP